MIYESQLQHDIRLALGREPDLVLFRNTVGSGVVAGRWQRFGLCPGSADLVGVLAPFGRWFCLEIKTERGKSSDGQEMWAEMMRRHGASVYTVRSVEEAREALADARMKKCKP